jgi:hypothetical protein
MYALTPALTPALLRIRKGIHIEGLRDTGGKVY